MLGGLSNKVQRLLGRILVYGSELSFAARTGSDVRSTLLLAIKTILFHMHNGRQSTPRWDGEFAIRLRRNGSDIGLTLRPYAGDLFVLYEVLMHECYALPRTLCDPARVRCILDCGANIGLTSIYLAGQYPQARIFAIEPHPENFRLLCANTRSEPRITPIQACLAANRTKPRFLTATKAAWGNQINDAADGIAVPAVTIDCVCQDYGIDCIDLLKMDIEGAEKEIFADAAFLSRVRLVVIELHDGYELEHFRHDIAKWGFVAKPPDPSAGVTMITAVPASGHAGQEATTEMIGSLLTNG